MCIVFNFLQKGKETVARATDTTLNAAKTAAADTAAAAKNAMDIAKAQIGNAVEKLDAQNRQRNQLQKIDHLLKDASKQFDKWNQLYVSDYVSETTNMFLSEIQQMAQLDKEGNLTELRNYAQELSGKYKEYESKCDTDERAKQVLEKAEIKKRVNMIYQTSVSLMDCIDSIETEKQVSTDSQDTDTPEINNEQELS